MARLSRIVISGQPLHIIHRGNNRQDIFKSEADMVRITKDIELSLSKAACYLHAYIVMTNHLHLLVTPKDKGQLTKLMQSLANRYVRYFNVKYQRTGTIWEGRFKSCLVDSDYYLFALYKYIEMNPVKAGMVEDAGDYEWSSYRYNALGQKNVLITEHELYTDLGENTEQRCARYRKIFLKPNSREQEKQIAVATMRGEVYGSNKFHIKIAKLISRATKLKVHGGDRKSKKYNNQAG